MLLALAACATPQPVPGRTSERAPTASPVTPAPAAAPPEDALAAYAAHAALLGEACARFEALGPGPRNQTIDAITPDGTITWSAREIMGAPFELRTEPDPAPERLTALGATPADLAWWRATLTTVGAGRVHRWELAGDGAGYHPWILLRSDTVFTWATGPTLVCRQRPSDTEPDPLLGEGCAKLDAPGRWWRCGPEVAATAPIPFTSFPEE